MVPLWLLAIASGATATASADVQLRGGYDSNPAYESLSQLEVPSGNASVGDAFLAVVPRVFLSGSLGESQLWLSYDLAYRQYESVDNGYRLGQQLRLGGDFRLASFLVGPYLAGVDYQASAFRTDRMRLGQVGLVARNQLGPVLLDLEVASAVRLFPFRYTDDVGDSEVDLLGLGGLRASLLIGAVILSANYQVERIDSNSAPFSGDMEQLGLSARGSWKHWRAELELGGLRNNLPQFPLPTGSNGRLDYELDVSSRVGYAFEWVEPFAFGSWETGTSNYAELIYRRFEGGLGVIVRWSGLAQSPKLQTPIRVPGGRLVRFRADLPDSHEARLIGSFNHWDPVGIPMVAVKPGHFEVDVSLPPGRYRYQLIVDGERQSPPDAQEYAADSMGGLDGVVEVTDSASAPDEGR